MSGNDVVEVVVDMLTRLVALRRLRMADISSVVLLRGGIYEAKRVVIPPRDIHVYSPLIVAARWLELLRHEMVFE